jgi:dTDP-4-amino-4,6-dideoxygalactose transaminase
VNQGQLPRVPLLDLRAQHRTIRDEVLAALRRVVDAQAFILGEEVEALERELAEYCGTRFAIGCASGTDALLLALLALGIGPGDGVVIPPFTFFATAGAVVRAGARPLFADVEASTFNLDVDRAAVLACSLPRVRAVIAVHLFGACADMDPLREVAARRGIALIEDAAQAIGAEYKGRRAGALADVGCFSFYPSKNLGGYGDGGLLTTNDPALAERLRALRVHGSRERYVHEWVGFNSRLDALQAAVLRVKLRHLDEWTEARRRHADYYRRRFAELDLPVVAPSAPPYATRHVWNQFVIRAPERDRLREHLSRMGIGTEIYYPVPLHLQPCFRDLGYRPGDFPVSEQLTREVLALPIYPELTEEQLETVIEAVRSFYRQ